MGARTKGWYADPVTVGAARYWDGRGWTRQIAWGGDVRVDSTPIAEVNRCEEEARASIVADYLADAGRRHVVAPGAIDALRLDVGRIASQRESTTPAASQGSSTTTPEPTATESTWVGPATAPLRSPARPEREPAPVSRGPVTSRPAPMPHRPVTPQPAPASRQRVTGRPSPVSGDRMTAESAVVAPRPPSEAATRAPVAPIPSQPGRVARWWDDMRRAVRSDLALHGLAYLGVLLLFAGVTGLIIFSFGDVSSWLRPVAELLVPIALFVSAWYLYRRRAVFVAASLTFLGGAITPIVVAASLTDGSDVPPDLSGRALPVIQGIAVAVVGVVYGFVALRRPANPLRHLAAPVLWLATGIIAGVWRDPVPAGYETVRADSLQLAVVLAAVASTVALCAWRALPGVLTGTTKRTALPVAAVVVVLELILAGSEGWPLASTIVAGLAALVLIELLAERLTPVGASIAQVAVVAVTAGRLAAVGSPRWIAVGAAVGLLGLVEYHGRRRPTVVGTVVGLATAGATFLLVLGQPAPTAVAFGTLTVWAFWRHVSPPEWLPFRDRLGVVPAVAAVVTTIALWDLGERGPALVATAATVLALAVLGRYWRPDDLLWRWFTPSAAGTVVVVSTTFPWGELPIEVAVATTLATAAVLLCALPVALRTWAAACTVVWALANIAEAVGVARDVQAIVLAAVALALVVGAVAAARPIGVHLATIGHLAGIGALAAAPSLGWSVTAVAAMATIGWLVVTVVDERGDAIHLGALRRFVALGTVESVTDGTTGDPVPDDAYGAVDAVRVVDQMAPLVTFGGVLVSVLLAVEASGRMAGDDPWISVIVAGLAAVAAGVVRVVPWRRALPRFLAWVTLVLAAAAAVAAVAAVGTDRGHWGPVVALALVLAVVVVTAPPRPLAFVWVGWASGGALALFVGDRLGLDRDWTDVAAAGWGAAALLGGLVVYRRRHGPVTSTDLEHEPLLLPPVVLGTAAFVVGGVLGLSDGSDVGIGWTATGLSLVVLTVALLIPLGALVAVAEALATVAFALLAPWEPIDRPWTFAPWVVTLLAIALATRRAGGWDLRRWDLPSFLVAHGVALVALSSAFETDTVVPTYALFGTVSMAVAAVLRRWPWAAVGAVLVLVAAFDAGHGWLALVLLAEGIALTIAGLLRAGEVRLMLLGLGAGAFIGAWFDFTGWLSWSTGTVFLVTMPSAAAVALLAAVALRTRAVPIELAAVWTIAGSGLALGVTGLADAAGRQSGGLTMAGSLLVLAVVAGMLAATLTGLLRWVTALFVAAAWLAVRWALQPTEAVVVFVGTGIALASLVVLVVVRRRLPGSVWLPPATGHAVFMQLVAVAAASAALPDTGLMVVALVAVGAELTVLGLLQTGELRWILLGLGAAMLVGAWFDFTAWLEWSVETVVVVTMPGASLVALLAAIGLRWRVVPLELAGVDVIAGSVVALATTSLLDEAARRPGGLAAAAGLLLLAATAATLAAVLSGGFRWVAAVLAAGALLPLHWAVDPTDAVATLVGTGLALVVIVVVLAVHGRRPDAVWLLPGAGYGAALQVAAAVAAFAALPETSSLVVVLLAVGAELVVFGVLLARPELFVAAPAAACAAWLVYAEDALRGNANWFTVPIGLTVLVTVGLLRWIRSWRGGEVTSYDVVALELMGMGFLVASPLARTLAGHLWNGVLAIAIGVLLVGWGAVTRVRWRAGFGAGTVVLAVVLLIGVPLSDAVTWRGPALWIVLSVVGIAAIVAASALESSRDRLARIAERLDEMTDGWERIPLHHDTAGDDHPPLPPPPAAAGASRSMGDALH